jgi:hypothetical protein
MIKKSFAAFLLLVALTTPVLAQNQSLPNDQTQGNAIGENPEFSLAAAQQSTTKEQALANLQKAAEIFSRQGNTEGVLRVKEALLNVDKIPFESNKNKLIRSMQRTAEEALKAGNQEEYREIMEGVDYLQR